MSNSLDQDDLYVDMTFAKVLDDKGLTPRPTTSARCSRMPSISSGTPTSPPAATCKRGIPATLSGTPKYNAHANDIDFQIESDFIGLMAPGLPQCGKRHRLARRPGHELRRRHLRRHVRCPACTPPRSLRATRAKWSRQGWPAFPARALTARSSRTSSPGRSNTRTTGRRSGTCSRTNGIARDPCPEGALKPFNIDAKLNGAYIALGLLYGDGDFGKTIEIATRVRTGFRL